MHRKIWRKVLVLFMALAVMMPNVVQAVEIIVMSESEEVTDQKMEKTSPEEEIQLFNEGQSDEVIEVEYIVEDNMSTNIEAKEHLIVDEESEEEEKSDVIKEEGENFKEQEEEPIDSNVDVTPTNILVFDDIEIRFSGTNGNSTATVAGYQGTGGNVVIPSSVLNIKEGWGTASPVTLIESNAFKSKGLTNVDIPSSVKIIELGAFSGNNLTSVNIPNSVTDIEVGAFSDNNLTSVNIPRSVRTIASGAFRNNNLTSLEISSDQKIALGPDSFANNSLTSVKFQGRDVSIGPTAFRNNNIESIYIPNEATFSGSSMFESNPLKYIEVNLANVEAARGKINSGVLSGVSERTILRALDYEIGTKKVLNAAFGEDVSYAISQQYQLQSTTNRVWEEYTPTVQWAKNSVNLSGQTGPILKLDSVTTSDSGVYHAVVDTVRYPNLTLDVGEKIAEFVFEFSGTNGNSTATLIGYNGNGGEVVIPSETMNTEAGWGTSSTVTAIGSQVFNTKGLTSVEIPDSVTSIGVSAFSHNQLTSVDIPNGVMTIERSAFEGNNLTNVEIPNSITAIRTAVFQNNSLSTMTIPDNVTRIEQDAFANNDITNLDIFSSMSFIGQTAFRDNPLKFIESNIENIDMLRSLLNTSAMGGVSERTILRALDYEIGTEKKRSTIVGQAVDYAISQQYRIRATSNLVWDMYSPEVQWEKDGSFMEEESYKSLVFENVQETDSGVYKAVVDGIIFSDLQLQVDPELEPDIPSIDPNEPSVLPENVNPSVEGLSIRYISNICFNSAPFSLLDQTLRLENEPMITVQDMRPREERSGWELLVSMDSTFMNGAEIVMNPFIHQENQTNLLIEGASELILNDEPQRFAGTTMIEESNPFGILSMGMGSVENPMTLRVPGKTGVNSYETTVYWQLVTGP